jgi:hypothetical protein
VVILGPTLCVSGNNCVKGNDYYYQCVPSPTAASSLAPNAVSQSPSAAPVTNSPSAIPTAANTGVETAWQQCGGIGWTGQ